MMMLGMLSRRGRGVLPRAEKKELEAGNEMLESVNSKQATEKAALEASNKALEAKNRKQAACLNGECDGKDASSWGIAGCLTHRKGGDRCKWNAKKKTCNKA